MTPKLFKSAVVALLLALAFGLSAIAAEFGTGQVRIVTTSGKAHIFAVELATTAAQRAQGLMDRTELGPNRGMWFDFGETRPVTMWMMNTPLPLDMLFVDEGGTVVRIAENTTPFSTDIVSSQQPVRYVLEINGGRARALGITEGARVDLAPAG